VSFRLETILKTQKVYIKQSNSVRRS